MAYLSKDEYTLRISIENFDEILAQAIQNSGLSAAQVTTNAESWASAIIKSYLAPKYNINAELGKSTPDPSRNFVIMQIMIDLSLCTIHKTINPRDIPEMRDQACKDAIQYLTDYRDGKLILDGVGELGSEGAGTFAASQPKFISKPYSDLIIFDDPSSAPNYPFYGNNP